MNPPAKNPPTPAENDELLTQAARRLRATAGRCVDARLWTPETRDDGAAWMNLGDGDGERVHHAWGMHGFSAEAAYAALVDPAAGLVLAGLLEDMASSHLVFGFRSWPVKLARQVLTKSPLPPGFD